MKTISQDMQPLGENLSLSGID